MATREKILTESRGRANCEIVVGSSDAVDGTVGDKLNLRLGKVRVSDK